MVVVITVLGIVAGKGIREAEVILWKFAGRSRGVLWMEMKVQSKMTHTFYVSKKIGRLCHQLKQRMQEGQDFG